MGSAYRFVDFDLQIDKRTVGAVVDEPGLLLVGIVLDPAVNAGQVLVISERKVAF